MQNWPNSRLFWHFFSFIDMQGIIIQLILSFNTLSYFLITLSLFYARNRTTILQRCPTSIASLQCSRGTQRPWPPHNALEVPNALIFPAMLQRCPVSLASLQCYRGAQRSSINLTSIKLRFPLVDAVTVFLLLL